MPFALHLGESAAEEKFFESGTGDLANMLGGTLIPTNTPVAGYSWEKDRDANDKQVARSVHAFAPAWFSVHCITALCHFLQAGL